jgi:hypothetical protein
LYVAYVSQEKWFTVKSLPLNWIVSIQRARNG